MSYEQPGEPRKSYSFDVAKGRARNVHTYRTDIPLIASQTSIHTLLLASAHRYGADVNRERNNNNNTVISLVCDRPEVHHGGGWPDEYCSYRAERG
jgi:hypothetical protein